MAEIASVTCCIEAKFLPLRIIAFLLAHTSSFTALIYFNVYIPLWLSGRYFLKVLNPNEEWNWDPERHLFYLSCHECVLNQPVFLSISSFAALFRNRTLGLWRLMRQSFIITILVLLPCLTGFLFLTHSPGASFSCQIVQEILLQIFVLL